jgi:hypothetical protein
VAAFNILGFLTERIGELIRDYNTSLRQVDNVVACPQIPAGNAVALFALFDLPVLTALNQNGVFGFTVRATFAPRRWRQVNFVIRNKL